MAAATYPVRVDATLDGQLSRWLWLVKWLLAIPHFVILAFLWLAFVVVSAVAFVAILLTGRYPQSLFEFNVGVLRWSWRVSYYTYGALGTDRYPPFTLDEVPDYPAHLQVAYPQRLSRGLVLVKWWLLAIPHYIIVGIFAGSATWAAWRFENANVNWASGGLIGLMVLIAAIALTVTGRYPQQIFDFVLGMNRWVLRVAAYSGLMTDAYPPFRLDLGGSEPSGRLTMPPPGPEGAPPAPPVPPAGPAHAAAPAGWTAGRIASLVAGTVLALVSVGLLGAGGVATWADQTQRDATGYLASGTHDLVSSSYAITTDRLAFGSRGDVVTPADLLGTVRLRVSAVEPGRAIFVGVAPQTAATSYLSAVSRDVVTGWRNGNPLYRALGRAGPQGVPGVQSIWVAHVAGAGTQTLRWAPGAGDWTVVVMNADGSPGVSVRVDAAATIPDLGAIGIGLLVGGGVLLAGAVLLITVPVMRAGRRQAGAGAGAGQSA